MFSSREACIEHRDAVVDVLREAFGTGEPWHVTPTLDAAEVRILEADLEAARSAFEAEWMQVSEEGPTGDWFELEVKPEEYT